MFIKFLISALCGIAILLFTPLEYWAIPAGILMFSLLNIGEK